jgi:hypothetical protein
MEPLPMIALDPKTTALVLIDLQNGILGRKLEPISVEDMVERGKALAGRFGPPERWWCWSMGRPKRKPESRHILVR